MTPACVALSLDRECPRQNRCRWRGYSEGCAGRGCSLSMTLVPDITRFGTWRMEDGAWGMKGAILPKGVGGVGGAAGLAEGVWSEIVRRGGGFRGGGSGAW